jgi:hypothetical protein
MNQPSIKFGSAKGDGNCYYRSLLQVAGLDACSTTNLDVHCAISSRTSKQIHYILFRGALSTSFLRVSIKTMIGKY